ncbi:MAG TPA: response regulator [Gammaproteobacteria bacterium]|nr:response regulator [Gammaproteobacteria bacterium]
MKKALIVDDSRVARTVLSRLLEENGVASDTAESAEVALEYLKHSRPDVVFLDHNMPGIDGFQALDAIKKNPVTATIPVMMYTSDRGEVYVGQARALGALGVLPKTVQPVEVAKILRTLHLIPGESSTRVSAPDRERQAPARHDAENAARQAPAAAPLDAESLRELLDELLSAKTAGLREDFRREIQRLAPPAPPSIPEPQPLGRRARVFALASVLLVAACAVFAYLYWAASASFDQATASTRKLAAETAKLADARNSAVNPVAAPAAAPSDVIGVLEWGVNQGGHYGFGTVPLDDARATVFEGLFEQLSRLGFAGTVTIDVHAGRFCMNYGLNGSLELAPPDQPAAACEQIGWSEEDAVSLGKSQSLAFANAVAIAAARYPRIKIESAARGSSEPAVPYPVSSTELTAGTWNAIAAANQRVTVRISPDLAGRVTGARR